METIVDQLKTVNAKSFLEEVKNPENINNLILKFKVSLLNLTCNYKFRNLKHTRESFGKE